jgi:hypothetical protein
MTDTAPASRLRSRLILLLIVALFLGSFGIAAILRFTGWTPAQGRNFGELLQPPVDVGGLDLRLEADARWQWQNQEGRWTALVRVPDACGADCWDRVAMLPRVRLALGRHAPRLPLLLLESEIPAAQRERLQPLLGAVAATPLPVPLARVPKAMPELWLVDPHGYLVLHYPEGFDPSQLRKDLGRVLK